MPPNPVPFVASITPSSGTAGGDAFTLSVTGSSFVPASVVSFADAPIPTTFVSSTALMAEVPASAVAAPGTYPVAVTSPSPGGGTSGSVDYVATEQTCQSHALIFDGSSNYATFPNTLGPMSSWTAEGWFNGVQSNGVGTLIQTQCGTLAWRSNALTLQTFPDCNGTSSRYFLDNIPVSFPSGWFHMAMVVTSASPPTVSIWIDGQSVATPSLQYDNGVVSHAYGALGASWRDNLPGTGATEYASVSMSGVRVSNNARYSSTFTPPVVLQSDANTVLLFTMNEGVGSALTDTSGNGRNGTITGATWTQSGPGTGCIEHCGNGRTDAAYGETCDDGNTVTESCTYGQTSCTICNSDCRIAAGATSYCGDGRTDSAHSETCDDGNSVTETCAYGQTSCTICNSSCRSASGATSYCGDGWTDSAHSETCDDGNRLTESCAYGQTSCTICNSSCLSASGATSYCGDGRTDSAHSETCDDGNRLTESCAYGQTSCTICNSSCRSASGATSYCGDGRTDSAHSETCDDGNRLTETCAYGQTSCTICNSICLSASGATSYCGDGRTDSAHSETCDDGNTIDGDGCSSVCRADTCMALAFNGTSDWASVPPVPTTSSFTLEGWLNGEPGSTWTEVFGTLCGRLHWSTSGISVDVFPACNGTRTQYTNWATPIPFIAFPSGWYHLAMVVPAPNQVSIYVNGQLVGSSNSLVYDAGVGGTYAGALAVANDIGHGVRLSYSRVAMAGFRVSNNARYSSNFAPPSVLQTDANTVLLYAMDEGGGSVLTDSSGNGRDGTIMGATWTQSGPGAGCGELPSYPNLELWLKADSLGNPAAESTVSLWNDSRAGSTRAAEQTSSTNRAKFFPNIVNGMPAVRFDGIDDEMLILSSAGGVRRTWVDFAVSQGVTLVAVVWPEAEVPMGAVFGDANNIIQTEASTRRISGGRHRTTANWPVTTSAVPSGAYLVAYRQSNVAPNASNTVDIFVNGVSVATGTGTNSPESLAWPLALGTDQPNAPGRDTNFKGYLAEIMVYSRALTASELQGVHAYVQSKYALP